MVFLKGIAAAACATSALAADIIVQSSGVSLCELYVRHVLIQY